MHATISRAGAKRKTAGRRSPGGKYRGDPVELIIGTALMHRIRDGVPYESAVVRDERGTVVGANADAGFALGRLRLAGRHGDPAGISEAQYDAGQAFAHLVRRHSAIMGYSLGSPRSPGFELVSAGLDTAKEPDEKLVLDVRRRFSNCYRTLMEVGIVTGSRTKVATITYDVCLDRMTFLDVVRDTTGMLGLLRLGLNSLSRVL